MKRDQSKRGKCPYCQSKSICIFEEAGDWRGFDDTGRNTFQQIEVGECNDCGERFRPNGMYPPISKQGGKAA